mgnify:CR=1 FL=1
MKNNTTVNCSNFCPEFLCENNVSDPIEENHEEHIPSSDEEGEWFLRFPKATVRNIAREFNSRAFLFFTIFKISIE